MPGARYGDVKDYRGQAYRGMKVGGVHRWDYTESVWEERKLDPGRWELTFVSNKRRGGKAPRGSGAGVGSGYHWLIVAHQWVHKTDANTYSTVMEGHKYLVAFKKPDWGKWNTQFRNQEGARAKAIRCLQDALARLEAGEGADLEDPKHQAALAQLERLTAGLAEPSGGAATSGATRKVGPGRRPARPARNKQVP